jgi:beta-glucosidase-like glycosyl hydrolase
MKRLLEVELYPFIRAVKAGCKMVMIGHLKVPAVDPEFPASLSKKTIKGLLRNKLKFKGLVTTDAMNMGAVSGKSLRSQGRACVMALNAGANILLHPEDPERVIGCLSKRWDEIEHDVEESLSKILAFKKGLGMLYPSALSAVNVGSKSHWKIAAELTLKSLKNIKLDISPDEKLTLLIIDDDEDSSVKPFIRAIRGRYKRVKTICVNNGYEHDTKAILNSITDTVLVAAVFSRISAWKGRSGLRKELRPLLKKAVKVSNYSVLVCFGSSYMLNEIKADSFIEAYSGSALTQESVGKILSPAGRE